MRDVPCFNPREKRARVKSYFAKAIHKLKPTSSQTSSILIAVLIPKDLIDTTFVLVMLKGAFTGRLLAKDGLFSEQADGWYLVLDAFRELTFGSQVRLLKGEQQGTLTPVGPTNEKKVGDVRII